MSAINALKKKKIVIAEEVVQRKFNSLKRKVFSV